MLQLNPNPTFEHTVYIPVPGGDPMPLPLTYKWRKSKDVIKFAEKHSSSSNVDAVLDCVTDWGLDDEFTRENVELLLENFPRAAERIVYGYIEEIHNAREKN